MSSDRPPILRSRRTAVSAAVAWVIALLPMPAAAQPGRAEQITVLFEEYPPYSAVDPDGRASGYSVDLARELLQRAGVGAHFEFTSWARVLLRARNEANVLVGAIVRLPERESQFHWLGQIAWRRGTLFRLRARPDVQIHVLADAQAYRIAVIKDDVSERELLSLGFDARQLDRSADYPSLLRKFFAGRCELIAVNQALAPTLLRQFGFDPALIEPVLKFSESRPSIAVSLATPEPLRQHLQQTWDALRREGRIAAIAAKYPMIAFE